MCRQVFPVARFCQVGITGLVSTLPRRLSQSCCGPQPRVFGISVDKKLARGVAVHAIVSTGCHGAACFCSCQLLGFYN